MQSNLIEFEQNGSQPPDLGATCLNDLPYRMTETGNGQRLAAKYGGSKLLWCSAWGWCYFNGKFWELNSDVAARRGAKQVVLDMYGEIALLEDDYERDKYTKFVTRSDSAGAHSALLKQAESEPEITCKPEEFDNNRWLFNVKNGTINLLTSKLQPHNPADRITRYCDVEFKPEAKAHVWEKFLSDILIHPELIQYVQNWLGYSLTGSVKEQCVFLLHGTGRNGKSTLLETIKNVLGDYARPTRIETFLERNNDTSSNDIAALTGCRFAYASEPEPGKRLAPGKLKELSGGDTVTARFLFKEFFSFEPQFKIALAFNNKPTIRDNSLGIKRRIKYIPFTVDASALPGGVDPTLPEKLKAEAEGILAWCVRGCLNWQQYGLQEPEIVTTASKDFMDENDPLREFIADRVEIGASHKVLLGTLYKEYVEWCKATEDHPVAKPRFRDNLSQRGVVLKNGAHNKVTCFGAGLRKQSVNEEEEVEPFDLFFEGES